MPASGWNACNAGILPARISAIAGGCPSILAAKGAIQCKGTPIRPLRLVRPHNQTGGALALCQRLPHSRYAGVSLQPGDYALDSGKSRAAARALLERRRASGGKPEMRNPANGELSKAQLSHLRGSPKWHVF